LKDVSITARLSAVKTDLRYLVTQTKWTLRAETL
jgi:hypothetical protein